MSEDVAQDQNPKFLRVNSMFNVFEVQYVALFPGHPYFRTLRLYDSAFRCKKETNSNDTIQRLID